MRESRFYSAGLIVLLIVEGCVGQISITSKPQNVAGVISSTQEFVLPCSISSPGGPPTIYTWSDSNPGEIYIGDAKQESHVHSQYFGLKNPEMSEQWTDYDLSVKTPVLDVADTYKCLGLQSGNTVEASADILLLATQPVCETYLNGQATEEYVAGDNAEISCEVTFKGRWAPEMDWSGTDQERDETSGDIAKWVYDIPNLTSTNDGNTFTCTTSYPAPSNPGNNDAINAPNIDGVETCSVELIVRYQPENIRIVEDSASVGGTLTCESDANPPVDDLDYEWTIGNDVTVYKGKTVDLLDIHAGDNNITCCASNEIRGEKKTECVESLFDVQTTTTAATTIATTTPDATGQSTPDPGENTDGGDSMSAGAIAGIVIGVIVLVVICLLLFYFFCIRRNKKEDEANATAPASKSNKPVHGDAVRQPVPHANNSFDDDTKPNYLYDDPNRNNDGVVYADLALDNTPRSRNPIQVYEPTTYAEIRHPQPQV